MIYRIKNWSNVFEGAKSKTYNNKTSCQMPTKHGLGYKRLVRSKNGPALFGAWCALIQILSRHNKERRGYCTDSGDPKGNPYTSEDLELLSDIPAEYFEQMLKVCTSQSVGWIEVIKAKDTTGDQSDTIVPLDSDLDSDNDLDLNSDEDSDSRDFPTLIAALEKEQTIENAVEAVYAAHDDFLPVNRMHIENAFKAHPDRSKWAEAVSGMAAKYAGVKIALPQTPMNALNNWLDGKRAKHGERNISEL